MHLGAVFCKLQITAARFNYLMQLMQFSLLDLNSLRYSRYLLRIIACCKIITYLYTQAHLQITAVISRPIAVLSINL